MSAPRALVLRAPGINCDRETVHACRLAGFTTEQLHINQLVKDPNRLLDYQFLVIPGGFSYGDDLGAGNLLAHNLTIHLGKQLQRFVDEGRPILGICNGFQALVRAGLLPGVEQQATLAENEAARFECRWITMKVQPGPCIFTHGIDQLIEIPVAHGEGQFVFPSDISTLQANGQLPLIYTNASGEGTVSYPANPNGSIANVAGICNAKGTVFGMMPHPERYVQALQHPQRRGATNGTGDGMLIFKNAFEYVSRMNSQHQPATTTHTTTEQTGLTYADAGVDVKAGEQAVQLMKAAIRSTHGPEVLAGVGAFAGAFSAKALQKMRRPVLVASTDGVGTKTLLAAQAGRYDSIGYDIVNHSINDLLVQGAQPLFFLDYIAMGKLNPIHVAEIVKGIAGACREAGCALLGGETAEMPDVYLPGAFDLAGTVVGAAEEDEIANGSTIETGDVILGFPSNGLHTNGYSLVRRVFANQALDTIFPELNEPLIDALLRPHRSYLHEIQTLRSYLADRGRYIKGMAHITGGGFAGNIARILPTGKQAIIDTHAWTTPALFQLIERQGNIPQSDLYRAFNMGIGMIVVLTPKSALEARCVLPELITIGEIADGDGVQVSL